MILWQTWHSRFVELWMFCLWSINEFRLANTFPYSLHLLSSTSNALQVSSKPSASLTSAWGFVRASSFDILILVQAVFTLHVVGFQFYIGIMLCIVILIWTVICLPIFVFLFCVRIRFLTVSRFQFVVGIWLCFVWWSWRSCLTQTCCQMTLCDDVLHHFVPWFCHNHKVLKPTVWQLQRYAHLFWSLAIFAKISKKKLFLTSFLPLTFAS